MAISDSEFRNIFVIDDSVHLVRTYGMKLNKLSDEFS